VIDLADSFMVGDMPTDFDAAKAAHPSMTTVGVKTGFGSQDPKHRSESTPDLRVDDLASFAEWFINRHQCAGPEPTCKDWFVTAA
jgi:phosphoglycolate phosphatase-like HAD superfamily hydrolase